ncbi:sensor domain-containing protein [Mycobacterium sp.]|uniref:sensor domain-containing protein n=1 Tax=Mycobacterium sp. TaxID=1785 RepID=UPI003D6B9799
MRQLAAGCAVAGLCILTAGCGSANNHAAKTTTTTTTTTSIIARPIVEREIDPLPLSPEQINAAMGAKNMAVTKKRVAMSDDSATMKPRECLAIDGSAQAQVYDGSGFSAVRDEALNDGDNFTHFAEQAMVLFPIAKQADAFFTTSAKQWPACRHYTHIQSGTEWTVGPVSNANGVLSAIATQENARAGGWACGRALAVRNNVIVDVNTCSANPANTAVDIANQIAAKVPTR